MKVYVTYDVSGKHLEVKEGMQQRGYKDRWQANNETYHLPNTCLWKSNVSSLERAVADLEDVVNEINAGLPVYERVQIKRCIVLVASPWAGITGSDERP